MMNTARHPAGIPANTADAASAAVSRVPRGTPAGGQFATSAKGPADGVSLDAAAADEWLPPGAHQVVDCRYCGRDETVHGRKADVGCRWCDNGKVTTDRYGQYPWFPDRPGTAVAFEVRRGDTAGWHAATVTASNDTRHLRTGDFTPNYALTIPVGGPEAREIGARTMLPVRAGQAAARHRVSRPEMIEEAVSEMHIGIDPTHDEVLAFLDRIDDDYLEDIAASAARFRGERAAELAAEGKTGPALDTTFDTSTLRDGAIDHAIAGARAGFRSQFEVTGRDHWHGYTLVARPDGYVSAYNDTAWERPAVAPLLPWSAPTGTPIGHVALDGTVTRVDC